VTVEKKIDPFKPQQPRIPGVSPSDANAKPEPPASFQDSGEPQHSAPLPINLLAIAVGALIILVALVFWSKSSNPKRAQASTASPAAATSAPAVAPKSAPSPPIGPGPIATTQELAKAWSAKRFLFRNSITGQPQPALVVRLPHGNYWGFSLVEPFGDCELEFITDLDKLNTDYGFRADHPMVGDPCDHTVYDLLRYGGGASSDDLVRGVIVQGSGIRPPMAIEIRSSGKQIIAVREE
jgi:hypothetical protein